MENMFYDCNSLTSLDVSNWDTGKVNHMMDMFEECSSLEYLIIGSPTFKFRMIDSSCGNLNTTCKILVPSALLDTFKTATNWSSRASQFDAIENYTITRSNGQVTVTPK
jgi:surface protein